MNHLIILAKKNQTMIDVDGEIIFLAYLSKRVIIN